MSVIAGFRQDSASHWIADLSCGHSQHMRHDPPWQTRPWVLTAEGRAAYIGIAVECRQCESRIPLDPPGD